MNELIEIAARIDGDAARGGRAASVRSGCRPGNFEVGIAEAMMQPFDSMKYDAINTQLRDYFDRYKTSNLKGLRPEEFADHIRSWLERTDHALEDYKDYELDKQRDLSVRFHWGHNHDFGDFKVQGRLGDLQSRPVGA